MIKKATFAAGCFWGVEHAFKNQTGVVKTEVGYLGGKAENPSYEEVCTDTTGHAEVVQLEYDSEKVSYAELLNLFWTIHDPTQVNRQGVDVGSQYRTAIFYHDEEQAELAKSSKQQLDSSGKYNQPIATEITAVSKFYRAEEYHQHFMSKARGGW